MQALVVVTPPDALAGAEPLHGLGAAVRLPSTRGDDSTVKEPLGIFAAA